MRKKTIVIICCVAVIVFGVALALILTLPNFIFDDEDGKKRNNFIITVNYDHTLGSLSRTNNIDIHYYGTSPVYIFTPYNDINGYTGQKACIKSVTIDGEVYKHYLEDYDFNVKKQFTYCFENISSNHTITVEFDTYKELEQPENIDFGFVTSSVPDVSTGRYDYSVPDDGQVYGSLDVWGVSDVTPTTGQIKVEVVPSLYYTFHSFAIPSLKENEEDSAYYSSHLADESLQGQNEVTGKSIKYIAEDHAFLLDSIEDLTSVSESSKDDKMIFLVVPDSITVRLYTVIDGVLQEGYAETDTTLYSNYGISSALAENYNFYSLGSVNDLYSFSDFSRRVEVVQNEDYLPSVLGSVPYYIYLKPIYYTSLTSNYDDAVDSRCIYLIAYK